jgi:hypothetical protein
MASRNADRADPAVHHVGRRQHVDAGMRLRQRLFHQHRHTLVVGDIAVPQHAVMAMIGIRIERHVAHQPDLGIFPLQQPRRAAHQVLRVGAFGPLGVLLVGRGRGEQRDGRNTQPHRLGHMRRQPVERDPADARHRRDGARLARPLDDEHRPDQVVDGQPVLGHQPPVPGIVPVAAGAGGRIAADNH